MSDDGVSRKTMRLPPQLQERLITLFELEKWISEAELVREALTLGIEVLERKYGTKKSG